jgi:hypothetical protein
MVKQRVSLVLTLSFLAWGLASCGRCQKPPPDAIYRNNVETVLLNLSVDLEPMLSGGSLTSIAQLKLEWKRRYPAAPSIFTVYEPSDVQNGVYPQYGLPARDYWWLPQWSTNDPPSTPLLWSYFDTPQDDVVYVAIDGSVHHCSSNQFSPLITSLSNRVERAALTK